MNKSISYFENNSSVNINTIIHRLSFDEFKSEVESHVLSRRLQLCYCDLWSALSPYVGRGTLCNNVTVIAMAQINSLFIYCR